MRFGDTLCLLPINSGWHFFDIIGLRMTWLEISFYSTLVLFLVISVIMILLVLIQRGRGGGLASAFSGSGAQAAFGAKTGDVLTWVTAVIFGIFVLSVVGLNLMADGITAARKPTLAPVNATPLETVPAVPVGGADVPPATTPATAAEPVPAEPATAPAAP